MQQWKNLIKYKKKTTTFYILDQKNTTIELKKWS